MAAGVALTVNNTRAVIEALFGVQTAFARTPKYAIGGKREGQEREVSQPHRMASVHGNCLGTYFLGHDRLRHRLVQLPGAALPRLVRGRLLLGGFSTTDPDGPAESCEMASGRAASRARASAGKCSTRRELLAGVPFVAAGAPSVTTVSIDRDRFLINGGATYPGRTFKGKKIEGLLMNSRMVQGIFDDENPETRARWNYPDTGTWDPERNTREFIAAMPVWRSAACSRSRSTSRAAARRVLEGAAVGEFGLRRRRIAEARTTSRRMRILDRADELGMVAIVGFSTSARISGCRTRRP